MNAVKTARSNIELYSRLARLAPSEETSAIYDARAAFASLTYARAFRAYFARARQPLTWMSAVGWRHSVPAE